MTASMKSGWGYGDPVADIRRGITGGFGKTAFQSRDRHRLHLSGMVGELAVDEVDPIRKDLVEVYLGIFHRIGAPGGE